MTVLFNDQAADVPKGLGYRIRIKTDAEQLKKIILLDIKDMVYLILYLQLIKLLYLIQIIENPLIQP